MAATHTWYAVASMGSASVSAFQATQAPSNLKVLQESGVVVVHNFGDVSASVNAWAWFAEHRWQVGELAVISATTTAASDASNNWGWDLYNETDAHSLFAAAPTTNGAELTANVRKVLTPDQNLVIQAGDCLEFRITKTGAPTSPITQVAMALSMFPIGDT